MACRAPKKRTRRHRAALSTHRQGPWANGALLRPRARSMRRPGHRYCPKAPTAERHAGASHLLWARDESKAFKWRRVTRAEWTALPEAQRGQGNVHPTVKPLDLCAWLVSLLCPPGGRGGDLFVGSGGIAIAAALLGRDWLATDLSPEAIDIARARLKHWQAQGARGHAGYVEGPTPGDVRPIPRKAAKVAKVDPSQVSLSFGARDDE